MWIDANLVDRLRQQQQRRWPCRKNVLQHVCQYLPLEWTQHDDDDDNRLYETVSPFYFHSKFFVELMILSSFMPSASFNNNNV